MKYLDNWHVVKDKKGRKHYLFGPILEYGDEEDYISEQRFTDMTEIPFNKWEAKDCAEILGNIMEDLNMHNHTYIPDVVYDICKKKFILPQRRNAFMRKFMIKMIENFPQ